MRKFFKAHFRSRKTVSCSLTLLRSWTLTVTCTWVTVLLLKSEKDAFEKALVIMRECGVKVKSVRLDQYYAGQSTADLFGKDTSLYVIPKRNATIKGSYVWKDMLRDFMCYPFLFLKEYFRREHSESGFSADKRCDGWKIWQRRIDRIETATMCKGVWHNLLRLEG